MWEQCCQLVVETRSKFPLIVELTVDLLFDWFRISCMTTGNFCFYLQNRLILTQEVNSAVILPPLFSVPWFSNDLCKMSMVSRPSLFQVLTVENQGFYLGFFKIYEWNQQARVFITVKPFRLFVM